MIRDAFLFSALFFAFFFLPVFSAYAQDIVPPSGPTEEMQTERPYADIPDAYFEEADEILRYCEDRDAMNQYYNCDCLSYRFLEERIRTPEAASNHILNSITNECLDATKAAGIEYESCVGNAPMLPVKDHFEEYCTCYANEYAKAVEKSGMSVTSKTIIGFQMQAHDACSRPQPQTAPARPPIIAPNN